MRKFWPHDCEVTDIYDLKVLCTIPNIKMDNTHIINFQHLQCPLFNQLKNLKATIFQMKLLKQIRLQYKLIRTKQFKVQNLQRNVAELLYKHVKDKTQNKYILHN